MRANIDLNVAWESEGCEKVVNAYCKKRYKDNRIKLPKEIESMIYLEVANSFEGENEKENRQNGDCEHMKIQIILKKYKH